jgi:uncharacterized repeat protein (TIGR01451 family)
MKARIGFPGRLVQLSALSLALGGVALADVAPPLTEGETIEVAGTDDTATANANNCTVGVTVTCPTLRDAIVYANSNANPTSYDIINLGAGVHTLTTAGTAEDAALDGDLDIIEPVNIIGTGAATTSIDGGGAAGTLQERLFDIFSPGVRTGSDPEAAGPAVVMDSVTLTSGYGKFVLGGAVFNDEKANLTLRNCAFTDNTATWDLDYGDPLVEGDGTEEEQGHGGAIYSKDVLSIDNCVFRGNVADNRVDTGVEDPDHPGENLIAKVGNGGAINASQRTTITNSTFGSDTAIDADSNRGINGGAMFMTGGNPLTIENTTFSYNDAISGGGLNNVSPSAPTTVVNSTFSGNHVTDSGAGIDSNAPITLINVTIANNVKDSNNKGSGLDLGSGAAAQLKNVLLDNNLHDGLTSSSNCGSKSAGAPTIVSLGGNLSSDETCLLNPLAGDQENVDPLLEPLADNNAGLPGTTLTHALPLNPVASPALDAAVTDADCPNNDQRGSIRPFDALLTGTAACDVGAFELYVERTDMHIENMTAPGSVVVGNDLTIGIVVDNGGGVDATGVTLETTLPAELVYQSATPSQGSCTEAGGMVSCDFGVVTAGSEASVDIVANAATERNDVLVGTYVSAATPADPFPPNNTANVTIDIVGNADVSITGASANPASVTVGSNTTVTVSLHNDGPSDASNLFLSGNMPALVTFVSGTNCAEAGGVITCTVASLASGSAVDVSFTVQAASAGTATVSADVRADQNDPDPTDNSGSIAVTISAADSDGGGGGGGCSAGQGARPDAGLLLMLAAVLGWNAVRRRRERVR